MIKNTIASRQYSRSPTAIILRTISIVKINVNDKFNYYMVPSALCDTNPSNAKTTVFPTTHNNIELS